MVPRVSEEARGVMSLRSATCVAPARGQGRRNEHRPLFHVSRHFRQQSKTSAGSLGRRTQTVRERILALVHRIQHEEIVIRVWGPCHDQVPSLVGRRAHSRILRCRPPQIGGPWRSAARGYRRSLRAAAWRTMRGRGTGLGSSGRATESECRRHASDRHLSMRGISHGGGDSVGGRPHVHREGGGSGGLVLRSRAA